MKTKFFFLQFGYFLIVVLVLIGSVTGSDWLNYPVKPFMMIWIGLFFLTMTKPQPHRWLVLLAFCFSWAGDVLLMLASKSDLFFFAGVGAFFLSQVTYILVFQKFSLNSGKGFIERRPLWILPFVLYLTAVFLYLYPSLEGIMKPVVALYALSLIGMSVSAFNRMDLTDRGSFWLLFGGSVFFVISDTLLAFNKFATPIPNGGFFVLATYMVAQYWIMMGLLLNGKTLRR